MEKNKRHRRAFIVSLCCHIALILSLVYFGFTTPLPLPAEEGVMVNFGNTKIGRGTARPRNSVARNEVKQVNKPKPKPASTPKQEASAPKQNKMTQDFEDAPVIKKEKERKRKEKEAKERERKRQEWLEKERIRKQREEAERQRKIKEAKEKERQRKIDAINSKAKNLFGSGNSNNSSQGKTYKGGNQGKVNGTPNSDNYTGTGKGNKGIGVSIKGRSVEGTLPEPQYNLEESGTVVVEIRVNKYGKVISARPGVRGSTTTSSVLLKAAKQAALKTRFNVKSGNRDDIGTITYRFNLN